MSEDKKTGKVYDKYQGVFGGETGDRIDTETGKIYNRQGFTGKIINKKTGKDR